jgi:hypothetical protein
MDAGVTSVRSRMAGAARRIWPGVDHSRSWPAAAERLSSLGVWLAAAAFVVQAIVHLAVYKTSISMLNADQEGNFWTWAGASATFAAGVGALVLACLRPALRVQLGLLAVAVIFLSADDSIALHEKINDRIDSSLGPIDDVGRFAWPLVYLPVLAAVFVLAWSLAEVAAGTVGRLLRAGLLLLVAGVVLELAGQAILESNVSKASLLWNLEVAVEEGCELAGWILVATGLLATAVAWASATAAPRVEGEIAPIDEAALV